MENCSTPCQAQGSKAVVLSNDKISGLRPIRKSKIHAVSTFVEHKGLCSIPVELMGCIAKQQAGDSKFPAKPNCNIHHRTAVRIDQNRH